MRTIGNIIWIVLGGWEAALSYAIAGAIFYLTIVGIPLGRISFRMAALSLTPFGKEITCGGGAPSMLANVVWFLLIGLWTAIYFAICGAVLCITIVGVPFGLQLFKMARLALAPFGSNVVDIR
ncbi:YccF domain-containing protein [Curtanaerobium respiraculi]|uniref:YccF domain-containing protein n=1 Tax=Curtanaerobium respiraculi TaxID=2949669 RepID=UPI0024B36F9D|nr:YccF domain-containing protein [Curtanaerobium respiraculi]